MKLGAIVAICLAAMIGGAHAQSVADYPSKPVKIVGPFAASSSGDIMARMMADYMQKRWGQTIIIENQAGGGSLIGTQQVKRAPPDGYTLLLGFNSLAMFDIFLKNPDIDTQKELTPISYFSRYNLVMLSSAKQPYKDFKELVAYAKANPGKVNFAMQANAPVHLFGALIANKAGIDWQNIPYTAAAALDPQPLLADETHVTLTLYSGLASQIQEGKIRALAVLADERTPLAPGVPTLKEQGLDLYRAQPSGTAFSAPQRVDRAGLAADDLDQHVGEEPRADADGDRVGERHQHDREERGDGDLEVVPGDALDLLHHQEAHQDQGGYGGLARDHRDQRGQEDGEQEQHAGHHGGESGARALATPEADSM